MKFQFKSCSYDLEFRRKNREVTIVRGSRKRTITSKYPYTTVTLYLTPKEAPPTLLYTATVGCAPSDTFSNSKGRLFALKALSRKITANKPKGAMLQHAKDLVGAIWSAYLNRAASPAPEASAPADKIVDGEIVPETTGAAGFGTAVLPALDESEWKTADVEDVSKQAVVGTTLVKSEPVTQPAS